MFIFVVVVMRIYDMNINIFLKNNSLDIHNNLLGRQWNNVYSLFSYITALYRLIKELGLCTELSWTWNVL